MKYQRIALTLLASSALVFVMSGVASAISLGGIGGRPAHSDKNNPRSDSIFIYELAGGQSKDDQLFVQNASDEQVDIELYVVDGVTTQTGDLTCRQEVEPRTDISSWMNISEPGITLAAHSDRLVDFRIQVPENADVGEHNGCIVIQKKTDETANQDASGVRLQTRQAIRVALIVPGDIHRDISIATFDVKRESGHEKYTVGVKNVGNVSADVNVKLVVRNPLGKVVYQNGGQYAMIANETHSFTYDSDLKPFLGGRYTVDLELSYDKKAGSWGIKDDAQLVTVKADQRSMFFWPSAMAWLCLVSIVLAIGLLAMTRRKSRQKSISFKKKG